MYKYFLLFLISGGFLFSEGLDRSFLGNDFITESMDQKYLTKYIDIDDLKLERRRGGKIQKGRRRGGSGLR